MHKVLILVEDELCEAYKSLATKAMGANSIKASVRVATVKLNDLIDFESLIDLTRRSQRSGSQLVVFAMDHEGPAASSERVRARERFSEAFQKLCDHMRRLPSDDPLKGMNIVRIEIHSCLEAWLLSDPQAIVAAFHGPSNYHPNCRRTEDLTPREARDQIAHIVQEVASHRGNGRLRKIGGHAVKSLGSKIAPYIDLTRARGNNASLDYFCDILENNRNGCQHPFTMSNS